MNPTKKLRYSPYPLLKKNQHLAMKSIHPLRGLNFNAFYACIFSLSTHNRIKRIGNMAARFQLTTENFLAFGLARGLLP